MHDVANCFKKQYLREVAPDEFYAAIPALTPPEKGGAGQNRGGAQRLSAAKKSFNLMWRTTDFLRNLFIRNAPACQENFSVE